MNGSNMKQNLFYQMCYEVLVLILPLVTSPYIARVIGPEGVGVYSYSYSIANYFVLFSMLGIKNYGCRAIAQVRDDPKALSTTFSSLLKVHIIVSLLCMAAYISYVCLLTSERIYAAIQSAFVLSALFDISWFYFGIEKFKLTVFRSATIKLLNVVCIFLFVRCRDDLWKYCLIMAVGVLLNQLSLWMPLKNYVRIVRSDAQSMLNHIKPLLLLFIPAIAISLYKYMDKIMIGAISGKEQLGFYENAEKVVNIPLSVISAFGTVMLPRMSGLMWTSEKDTILCYIMISMRYIMCLAFALTFGLAGVGRVFAPLFWGEGFAPSGVIIMGLATTIPFISFADVIRTQFLIPTKRDREYLCSVMMGAVVNLIINFALLPSFGALGATVGTIAAEACVCTIQMWSVRRYLELNIYLKNALPFFLTGSCMFWGVYFLGRCMGTTWPVLFLQILLGMIFYSLSVAAYLGLIHDDTFMKILRNVKRQGNDWNGATLFSEKKKRKTENEK